MSQRVSFYYGSVYSALPESLKGNVNVIVSNPPYVSDGEYLEIDRGIRDFEPSLALKGGSDGMNVIRQIAAGAADFLGDEGALAMEIGETQAESSRELLESTRRFPDTEIVHDLSGRPRVIIGRKK
jgi:release factor glutamine methyltransferase